MIHVNGFMKCEVLGWKRFLQTGLEKKKSLILVFIYFLNAGEVGIRR